MVFVASHVISCSVWVLVIHVVIMPNLSLNTLFVTLCPWNINCNIRSPLYIYKFSKWADLLHSLNILKIHFNKIKVKSYFLYTYLFLRKGISHNNLLEIFKNKILIENQHWLNITFKKMQLRTYFIPCNILIFLKEENFQKIF